VTIVAAPFNRALAALEHLYIAPPRVIRAAGVPIESSISHGAHRATALDTA
jgi:hypothetical protein